MRIALRIDVTSLRGLREGVPNLMRLFSEYQVGATFFFPLGHDLAGRYPLETWRARHRVGLAAMTFGTLAIAPSFGGETARYLDLAVKNGHEAGLIGYSPLRWRHRLAHADADWVSRQCERLLSAYREIDGPLPVALATPGWQVHPALLAALSADQFVFSSLSRGRMPFFPVLQGQRSRIPEIPTTLPTVDELLAQPGVTPANVHEFLYAESRHLLPAGHVYTANADREGIGMLDLMEKLLVMWKGQDGAVRRLGDMLKDVDRATLPHHQVGWGQVEGRTAHVAMQSLQVPA